MIIELTGNQSKLDAFIRLVSDYEVLELARTGVTGLSRGMDDVKYLQLHNNILSDAGFVYGPVLLEDTYLKRKQQEEVKNG